MTKIILLMWVCLLSACSAQKQNNSITNTNPIEDTIMFEKFDFDLDATGYAGYESVPNSSEIYGSNGFYKLKNGGAFNPFNATEGETYIVIPSLPFFYSIVYNYYLNGNIKSMGRTAGLTREVKIGTWKYYDEIGRIKEVDEEKKFVLWGYDKVLATLDKDGVIDLKTGENREANRLRFFFDKDTKIWKVKVFKKEKNKYVEEYWEYLFEGNTGKHSREWYEEYNDDIKGKMGEGMPMPPLKNSKKNKSKRSTAVYKTYEGKDYTEAEWMVFEQEQYNEHLRKTGRGDLVKSTDIPKTETKNSLLADETDVKPQKKKGFLGGLFS